MYKKRFIVWDKDFWIVIFLWIFFQTAWYLYLGIQFGLEAAKYIEEAQFILDHQHFSQFRYLFYFTTIAVIAIAKLLHVGLIGALIAIMLVNLFSYLYFFRALKLFFNNRAPAFWTIGILLSFWPYQSWSLFLFTECFFYSTVLLLFGHLLKFRTLNFNFLFKTAILLILVIFSRPLGILFIFPVLLFVFFKLSKKLRIYIFIAAFLFLLLLNFVMQIVFTTTPDWNMTRALTEDSIICDIPRADASAKLDLVNHPNQIYQLFYYVTHNFSHFAGLAAIRLQYFFTMVRNYYSSAHNYYLIAYLVLFYGSVILGLRKILRLVPVSLCMFLFISILLFALTIALQCDDYHNRFFLTLTPFFAFMTVLVLWPIMGRFSFFSKSRKD
jgi:hypothetical protein